MLLIKQLVGESNRMFAGLLIMFSLLNGISYKTIERLYSDEEVALAIHNLLILKKKGVKTSDATGYSLTIKKNYESYAQKDRAKEEKGVDDINNNNNNNNGKSASYRIRVSVYTFTIMDLGSI